ncbi:hypothetical protein BU198_34300 [Streptomyces sp. CBMA156]|nr:hypothetical protein [Streptomyces sp. CBMA156]MBD0669279.1 hypothetical protein [Streptomyces sp. CBMA156]MBD0675633.1 hypothetical protein [Streptomyces sp. CBMA156]
MAFPGPLADDVRVVLAAMGTSRLKPAAPFPVDVQGRLLAIPTRLYNDEPSADALESLSPRQLTILHCLYTRHHDGRIRRRHLECVVGSAQPWVVPYVVQLAGEYVVEILVVIREALGDLDTPGTALRAAYGRFIVDNPSFFARTQRRVVSYWSCYHRLDYTRFPDYPGCTVLELLRAAASDLAGHPWPRLTPPAGRAGPSGHCQTPYRDVALRPAPGGSPARPPV